MLAELDSPPIDDTAENESLLAPFSPFWEKLEHEPLPDILLHGPPDIENLEAVRKYQESFAEYFGYRPIPVNQDSIKWPDETQPMQLWGFTSGHSESAGSNLAITSDPVASSLFAELGLAGFDQLQLPTDRSFVTGVVSISSLELPSIPITINTYTLTTDGLLKYHVSAHREARLATKHILSTAESPEFQTDRKTVADMYLEHEATETIIESIFELANHISNPLLKSEFLEYLEDIGITRLEDGSFTIPTLNRFESKLQERQKTGKYAPPYIPIASDKATNSGLYNQAASEGSIPFSTKKVRQFLHDIAVHAVNYLKYGSPLFSMAQIYAEARFEDELLLDQGGQPSHDTTFVLDFIMSNIAILGGEIPLRPGYTATLMWDSLDKIADQFNKIGISKLQETEIVAWVIEHYGLNPAKDEITSEMLFDGLEELALIPSASNNQQ